VTLPGSEPQPPELAARLAAAVAARGAGYVPRTHHLAPDGRPIYTNRLALERSPYLLQHAHNPVDWYPWGDEAFAAARRLSRPVFLSIGYSTCHWCHVMEGESFEDQEIAAFLNAHYVPVKVDREERPDVDAVYMSAVQQLTGSGGWPMSVWLTPEREPFFAGTYFPPRDGARGARHGFLTLLREIHHTYERDPARVVRAASALVEAVRMEMEGESAAGAPGAAAAGAEAGAGGEARGGTPHPPSRAIIDATVETYRRLFDPVHGGIRRAPKFPSNIPVRLLLRHAHRTGDAEALHMAVFTLQKMAAGGMYDQLGGGFHRYSTDAEWLVPHFEKMLYDNALLAVAYAEAFQLTGRGDLGRMAREICDYVLREMTDAPTGGFYSATDADSEGEEGRFFVWTEDEIRRVLGEGGGAGAGAIAADVTDRFLAHYDVRPGGNWEGHTILNVPRPDEEAWAALGEARARLYAVRARRVPPLRDEKILAAWNGLMISGLAVAGRVLGERRYLAAAARAAELALSPALRSPEGRLYRVAGSAQLGFLDDYAFMAAGLIDLYEATFDARWLREGLALAEATERLFAAPGGGWFMSSGEHEALIARERPGYDGAEPSGTSVAMMNASRLAVFTDDDRWRVMVERAFEAHRQAITERPLGMTEALLALDFSLDVPREVAVVWPAGSAESAEELLAVLGRTFLPARALAGGPETEMEALGSVVPFVREKVAQRGRATAYVCRRGRCELPATDAETLARQLGGGPPGGETSGSR
jgi:uncharacterized protein YyaL (SSP411 family)